jgi:hypothetical protein
MIQKTLDRITARVQNASTLSDDERAEIIALLESLRGEIQEDQQLAHLERIEHVLGVSELTTHDAAAQAQESDLVGKAVEAMKSSVLELEASHPKASQAMARLAQILSGMGI